MRRVLAVLGVVSSLFCFGAAEAQDGYRLLRLDGGFLKWGVPALGTGATITYAIADQPQHDSGARNCRDLRPLAPLLSAVRVPMDEFMAELRAAMGLWESVANIRFVAAPDSASAQIVIGAQGAPHGRAFANVDFEDVAGSDTHRLRRSLVCLNPLMPWKVGFGGNAQAYDLRYVLAHEIGHAIGLDHPSGSRGQLMSFRYDEDRRGLSAGDIAGVEALYGPRLPISRAAALRDEPQAGKERQSGVLHIE